MEFDKRNREALVRAMNLKYFKQSVLEGGGCSYNLNTGKMNPRNGYFVSIANAELVVKNLTDDVLKEYIGTNADLLSNQDVFLGAWKHKGEIYLDVSQQIPELEMAIYKGILRNQRAIFDAQNQNTIYIPTPQKSGTEFQKKAYAEKSAQQLTEKLMR